MSTPLYIGIDMGTSGARALVIEGNGEIVGRGDAPLSEFGEDIREAENWWLAVQSALDQALKGVERSGVAGLSIDGTSGTVLAIDDKGAPIGGAMMYNDRVEESAILARIKALAPPSSAAHGPTSALAKALVLQKRAGAKKILHQADWLAWQFSGQHASDENNALKTGYDPISGRWPGWIIQTGINMDLLPKIQAAGSPVARITEKAAKRFELKSDVQIIAGTTDGCASFLATGAQNSADAVSVLGTTITLKILCDHPLFAPEYGIYSHKILGKWLAGGASNSGGNVLLHYFSLEEIISLSAEIDPSAPVETNYYPLVKKGERFPINDPELPPNLSPRPQDNSRFLHDIFSGMAEIEALGYRKIHEIGGPKPATLRTMGGGAANQEWTAIRQKALNIAFLPALSNEAAYGAALLARMAGVDISKNRLRSRRSGTGTS